MKETKLILAASVLLAAFATPASATPYRMTGVGFAAPEVEDAQNITWAENGAIVLDHATNLFKGYNGSAWLTLSSSTAPQAPTVQLLTSGTTYTTPANVLHIRVRMVGGGGGGSGGGNGSSSAGAGGTNLALPARVVVVRVPRAQLPSVVA
jgi:hypothetical protein